MTKQQLPARIWAEDTRDCGAWFDHPRDTYAVEFIRADIAERVAEALEESRLQIEYMQSKFEPTGSGNVVLSRIHSALSAFRSSSTQATEAGHE